MTLTHGELFAGIGGFGIGFDNAGAVTKWHVEIDKHCQSILSRHWPDAQIESDVCEVGKHNLSPVDTISFGSPCQDLSIAGKRKGFQDGTRSNLFFEAVRIIQELNPRYAVWENVPGALSSHGGNDFQSVLESLLDAEVPMPRSGRWATAGMVRSGQKEIAWRCLDAQYFGVPQRRRRIFLVFCPRGDSASEILFESEGVSGNTPPRREAGKVAPTLPASGAGTSRPGGQGAEIGFYTVGALQARDYKGVGNQYVNKGKVIVGALSAGGGEQGMTTVQAAMSGMLQVFDRQQSDRYGEIAPTLSTSLGHHGWSIGDQDFNTLQVSTPWDSQRARIHDAEGTAPTLQSGAKTSGNIVPAIAYTLRRTNYDGQEDLSPTLNMDGGGGGMPAVSVRRLTPTECLRLQGFPDQWLDGESDTAKYRQCGNAVAVPVVEWVARRIAGIDTS